MQLLSAIFTPFDAEFKPYLDRIAQAVQEVKLQIDLAEHQASREMTKLLELDRKEGTRLKRSVFSFQKNATQEYAEAREWRVRNSARQIAKKKAAIRTNFSSIDHVKPWKRAMRARTQNTAEWFKTHANFVAWKEDKAASIFSCCGNLGTGKTVLLSNIVAGLHASRRSRDIISYFLCQPASEETMKARSIVGSIVLQLLESQIEQAKTNSLEELYTQSQSPDATEIMQFLISPLDKNNKYFIIIDGLDDCGNDELLELESALVKLHNQQNENVKILISTSPTLDKKLSKRVELKYRLILKREEIDADIHKYISNELDTYLEDGRLVLGDPALVVKIVDSLQQGSHGMFLWTRLILDEICQQSTDTEIVDALGNLPPKLSDLLDRKLQRISTQHRAKYAMTMLQFSGITKRPLIIEEWREVLTIKPDQISLDRSLLPNDMELIIADCCGLLYVDEEDDSVHLVHHSVQQHLFNCAHAFSDSFVRSDVDFRFGGICLTYLHFSDFQSQLIPSGHKVTVKVDPLNVAMEAVNFPHHTRIRVAQILLRQRKTLQNTNPVDLQKYLCEVMSTDEKPEAMPALHFISYARLYWFYHVATSHNDARQWTRFCQCLEKFHVEIVRPWEERPIKKYSVEVKVHAASIMDSFEWGIRQKHAAFFNYYWTRSGSVCQWRTPSQLRRILKFAIESKQLVFVQLLVRSKGFNEKSILNGGLHSAALSGQVDILCELLAAGADATMNVQTDTIVYSSTALHAAAAQGYTEILEILLAAGHNVSALDGMKRTPIECAAGGGHDHIVRVLIAASSLHAEEHRLAHTRALERAAEAGHIQIVDMLLDAGLAVNGSMYSLSSLLAMMIRGFYNGVYRLLYTGLAFDQHPEQTRRVFHLAVKHGDADLVQALIKNGANLEIMHEDGQSIIYEAVKLGHLQIVKFLVAVGVDLKKRFPHAKTALILACEYGSLATVDLVRFPHDEVNATDDHGYTALIVASQLGKLQIVTYLVNNGAIVNHQTALKFGMHALCAATDNGYLSVVDKLLDAGADANAIIYLQDNSRTSLMISILRGHSDITSKLLAAGADVNLSNNQGKSALYYAALEGDEYLVTRLLAVGARVNIDFEQATTTALHAAIEARSRSIIKRLLAAGAVATIEDEHRLTPMHYALKRGYYDIAKILYSHYDSKLWDAVVSFTKKECSRDAFLWASKMGQASAKYENRAFKGE
ncbi:hypothetical protein MMC25_004318 [Agyrium rufum]|nr:hypothetical protein [Agyrium rufum]